MSRRIYIAGPYTGDETTDELTNVKRAIDMADRVMALGAHPFVPHLNHFWHCLHEHSYDEWIRWCLAWLVGCDAMIIIAMSPGVEIERNEAIAYDIPVFDNIEALASWLERTN